MTKKEFKIPLHKAFGKQDGSVCLDFSVIEYIKDGISKGARLKVEGTTDGFKSKTIIQLEKNELIEMLGVIHGKINQTSAFRKDPVKNFTMRNQGDNFYAELSVKGGNKTGVKLMRYDMFVISSFILEVLRQNNEKMHYINNSQITLEQILSIFPDKTTSQPNSFTKKSEISKENVNNKTEVAIEKDADGKYTCECGYKVDEKVKDFSVKRFGKVLCIKCQKAQ